MTVIWNPADKTSGITLSNGNLTAAYTTYDQNVRANTGYSTGKYYWEIFVTSQNASSYMSIGVAGNSTTITSTITGWADRYLYRMAAGEANGLTLGFRLDRNSAQNTLLIYKNNVLFTTINVASAGISLFPCFGDDNGGAAVNLTANFGASAFTYALPSGFAPFQPPTLKYLFQDGTNIKYYSAGTWSIAGVSPVTQAMFDSNGMSALTTINNAALQLLTSSTPQLLLNDNTIVGSHTATITALPPNKLVFPTGDIILTSILNIDSLTLTATQTAGGAIRIITSIDSGTTWKTWNGSAWVTIDSTNLTTVKANGMTISVFNARVGSDWNTLIGSAGKIRFAYYLELAISTDTAFTDTLSMTADMVGVWREATKGTDYNLDYTSSTNMLLSIYANGDYKINYGGGSSVGSTDNTQLTRRVYMEVMM